jgi:hypothetical protein
MPAARLSDSQKAEVVERFRAGEGLQPLADAYDCSPNTVSRVVKAALDPGEYDRLKEQRNRRSASPRRGPTGAEESESFASHPEAAAGTAQANGPKVPVPLEEAPPSGDAEDDVKTDAEADEKADAEADPPTASPILPAASVPPDPRHPPSRRSGPAPRADAAAAEQQDGPAMLAIDDADDFGDDEADDDLALDGENDDSEEQVFVPVPLLAVVDDHTEIRPLPLTAADLPGSAWMLVDKTVELQARPLSEFTELGRLPAEEQDRQALMVFVNPRQAKRHCGRTQRVIKIPDPAVFTRTAPYLLAQGISRVVIEGALFALPGS